MTDSQTLLSQANCYLCVGVSLEEALELALLASIVANPVDPDVKNFIARANITDPVQISAIKFLFSQLKSAGFWTRFDCLYPIIPSSPYLNAKSTSFTLVPVGVTTATALGIAGDGATGYFNSGFNPVTFGGQYTKNNASIGVYCGTALPTDVGVLLGAYDGANGSDVYKQSPDLVGKLNAALSITNGNFITDFRGTISVSVTSNLVQVVFLSTTTNALANLATTNSTNQTFYLDAFNNNGVASNFSNAQIRAAWIGAGFTITELVTLSGILDGYESILGRKAP